MTNIRPFTILLLLIFGISNAQTHRFVYELTVQHPHSGLDKYNMVLDINPDSVKFYDYEFLRIDSIRKKSGKNIQTNSETDQRIFRKRNSNENKTFHTHTYDYFVVNSTDKIDWKIEKETKKTENFLLQKATTEFGGRQWIAWFDSDIPFQEGPYKFQGLSGLIFEIYDTENIFHYTLIKSISLSEIADTTDFLETYYGKKPIPINIEKYHKIKLDYYHNIIEILNDFAKKGGTIASEDDISTPEEISKKRNLIQKSIKENYLPIEKNKAIPYPNN
ncbi:MAG: GLPGLI family protein [Cruoricaptor ignavus]|nr:GLPGLI family protein [Cruoricaptor ignavus]